MPAHQIQYSEKYYDEIYEVNTAEECWQRLPGRWMQMPAAVGAAAGRAAARPACQVAAATTHLAATTCTHQNAAGACSTGTWCFLRTWRRSSPRAACYLRSVGLPWAPAATRCVHSSTHLERASLATCSQSPQQLLVVCGCCRLSGVLLACSKAAAG